MTDGVQVGEEVIWTSDRGWRRPKRMLLQNKSGSVRLLSLSDNGDGSYREIMSGRSLNEMMKMADLVLSGNDLRISTTLTKNLLAANVIQLFFRMRSLEEELSALKTPPKKPQKLMEAAE